MKTKITLEKLINSRMWLEELINIWLPIEKAFDLRKFVKTFEVEFKTFEEVRNDLIKELWEVDGDKTEIVNENNKKEFISRIRKVLDREVDIEVPDITKDDFLGKEVKTSTLIVLDWLIK